MAAIKKKDATQRSIFFKDLYSTVFSDPDISYAFNLIEGDKEIDLSEYKSELHDRINKLLAQCELISALYIRGAISEKEMDHFKYDLIRTYENENIQKYFKQIDEWTRWHRFTKGPFAEFRSSGAILVNNR